MTTKAEAGVSTPRREGSEGGKFLPARTVRAKRRRAAPRKGSSLEVRCSAPLSFFCFPAAQAKEKKQAKQESGAEHRTPKDAATLAERFP